MSDLLALITIMVWPVVPLFWIPVHGFPKVFKRLGILTYLLLLTVWLPIAYLIYLNRHFLIHYKIDLSETFRIIGVLLFLVGLILHLWTGRLLGILGLMGFPEISKKDRGVLIAKGPFLIVRHPTYLAHTLLFSGIFLITEVIAVGVLTLIDFVIVNALIISLEEKELLDRFGDEYKIYKQKVRYRFFPGLF